MISYQRYAGSWLQRGQSPSALPCSTGICAGCYDIVGAIFGRVLEPECQHGAFEVCCAGATMRTEEMHVEMHRPCYRMYNHHTIKPHVRVDF